MVVDATTIAAVSDLLTLAEGCDKESRDHSTLPFYMTKTMGENPPTRANRSPTPGISPKWFKLILRKITKTVATIF